MQSETIKVKLACAEITDELQFWVENEPLIWIANTDNIL